MKTGKLRCPHCAERVSFAGAFQAKANEEYFCPSCRKFSKVFLSKDIKNLARILAVLVGIVMVLSTYSIYKKILTSRKSQYAAQILALSERAMKN